MWIWVASMLACSDLGVLAGGDEECPAGQTRTNGQCVAGSPDGGPIPKPPEGCPEGTQDNDNDNLCEATCAKAPPCGAHAKCDDSKGKAVCNCPLGYVLEATGNCSWRGGPKDPGFYNQPSSWTVSGGAVIEAAAIGKVDLGLARIKDNLSCSIEAGVSQKFMMPTFAESEPFALEVSGSVTDGLAGGFATIDGRYLSQLNLFAPQQPLRVCLGERSYGHEVELALKNEIGTDCVPSTSVDFDHAKFVPAPTCPAVGTLLNGDFEGTGGWAVYVSTSPAGAVAEVASAVGSGGSRGGRIATTTKCQVAELSGQISTPMTTVARPALSFTYKGTNGATMLVTGDAPFGEVKGTATFQSAKLCLPEHTKGFVTPLKFSLAYESANPCTTASVREFVFDDVKIVDEPTCPAPANVIDGSFENSGLVTSWQLVPDFSNRPSNVTIEKTGGHTGTSFASLSTYAYCSSVSVRQTLSVPPPAGTAGAAVKFWYRTPFGPNNGSFSTFPGTTLTAAAQWTQKTVCIPAAYVGSSGRLYFTLNAYGGAGNCSNNHGLERIDFDDVEVVTDPSCPAQ